MEATKENVKNVLSAIKKVLRFNKDIAILNVAKPVITVVYNEEKDMVLLSNIKFHYYDTVDVDENGIYFHPEHGDGSKCPSYAICKDEKGIYFSPKHYTVVEYDGWENLLELVKD